MPSWAAVRDKRSATGSWALIEAGPEMRGPSPARRRAFPLWGLHTKPMIVAGIVAAALGAVVLARGIGYPMHRGVARIGGLEASGVRGQQGQAQPERGQGARGLRPGDSDHHSSNNERGGTPGGRGGGTKAGL